MYLYIYKTIKVETGEYYIGMRRSYRNKPEEDSYMGSGKWITEQARKNASLIKRPNHAAKKHFQIGTFEKIILKQCNAENELIESEISLLGDLWKTDPLCMNKMIGGITGASFGIGEDNINADKTIYHLWDHKSKTELYLTRHQMKTQYNMTRTHDLINGKIKSCKGIVLYQNRFDLYGISSAADKRSKREKYRIWDTTKNEEYIGTRSDIRKRYDIKNESELISGKYMSINGIVLYENKDVELKSDGRRITYKSEEMEFWDHKTNTKFNATRHDLVIKYNLDKRNAYSLFTGKIKINNGICLLINKNLKYRKRWLSQMR